GRLRELEDLYAISRGGHAALEKRIVELSLRSGVLCRFTAFVVVDRSEVVNAGGQRQKVVQPVELPRGWDPVCSIAGGPSNSLQACPAPPGRVKLFARAMPLSGARLKMRRSTGRPAAPRRCAPPQALRQMPAASPSPDLVAFRQRARELLEQGRGLVATDGQ